MDSTLFRRVYILLSLGAITAFFGHAMWAVRGKESFVELVTGSFDNALGISVGTSSAESIVRTIGWIDVGISIALALALVGFIARRGALYRFAASPVVIGLYAWGAIWGFTTAASRMTGAGLFYPEIWDLVERGPNFVLPAALVLMSVELRHRQQNEVSARTQVTPSGRLAATS
jgi:hypothetical protein